MYYDDDKDDYDLNEDLRKLVARGLVEQFIDEEGNFVFELTEMGEQVARDALGNIGEEEWD
jgi:hypothetical protein